MRIHGTLTRWNDDRGFGFISQANAGADIFVHISAFPRDGVRPKLGEIISYETETGLGDKLRAVRIMRPGRQHSPQVARNRRSNGRASRLSGTILGALIIAAIGGYVYLRTPAPTGIPEASRFIPATPASAPSFECDGRNLCSQMTSCEEATYFLQHCPGPQMDGDNDRVPCERQWCN